MNQLNMPASIKRDLRNLSKGDLIKVIAEQHKEVMLKNAQLEDASAQVEEIKQMSRKLKEEYELDKACAGVAFINAQNHAVLAPNSLVVDEDLSQAILEENEALKRDLQASEQNVKALEKQLFDLRNESKKPKHRLVSAACGFDDTMKAEIGVEDLRSYAKKANIEVLVVIDKRSGRIPQKRRFSELREI